MSFTCKFSSAFFHFAILVAFLSKFEWKILHQTNRFSWIALLLWMKEVSCGPEWLEMLPLWPKRRLFAKIVPSGSETTTMDLSFRMDDILLNKVSIPYGSICVVLVWHEEFKVESLSALKSIRPHHEPGSFRNPRFPHSIRELNRQAPSKPTWSSSLLLSSLPGAIRWCPDHYKLFWIVQPFQSVHSTYDGISCIVSQSFPKLFFKYLFFKCKTLRTTIELQF